MKTILALKQKHAGLCDKQKVIVDKAVNEGRALAADETTELETLQTEIDGLAKTIEQAEKMEARNTNLNEPASEPYRPAYGGAGEPSQNNRKKDDGGFANVGEMLYAVKNGDSKGRLPALEAENGYQLPEAFSARVLGHGPDGFGHGLRNFSTTDAGILIPPQFSGNILSLEEEPELIAPMATFIPAGDPPDAEFTIPYFDQGSKGANGGVEIFWTAEAKEAPDVNEPGVRDLTLKPQEASGLATVNNRTLQNWRAAGAFLQNVMGQAWKNARDMKFLRGSGAGSPLGILKSPAAIKINRKTANTVTFEDASKMLGRLLPEAMAGAQWCGNITLLPDVIGMVDGAGRLIYLPGNVTQGIPATLLGIPIRWTGKSPVKGQEGDLCLCNCRYYLMKPGSGPFVALSEHVKFKTNQTVFRIVASMDGQPWVKEPLKLQDGNTTVSPFVILK